MPRFSFLRRKTRHTKTTGFWSYKSSQLSNRKPFVPKQDRFVKGNGKKRSWRILLKLLLILIPILILLYLALISGLFKIEKLDIKGSAETLEEQGAVRSYLEGWLGKNMLLIPLKKHEKSLLAEYPYLKSLNIKRTLSHTLVANLITYDPKLNVQVTQAEGTQLFFVVNELGYIASTGLQNENLPNLTMDSVDAELKINDPLLPKEKLDQILGAASSFEAKFNMQILELNYLKRARELHLYTEREFFIWIDLSQDVDEQFNKLKKSLTELNIYEAPLEYVDLRISGQNGEKVIYKLRE